MNARSTMLVQLGSPVVVEEKDLLVSLLQVFRDFLVNIADVASGNWIP